MIVPITDEIIGALLKLKLIYGSNEELGKLCGISKKHIGQILSGNVAYVRRDTWEAIEPHIKKLLPKNALRENTPTYSDLWEQLATWLREFATKSDQEFIIGIAKKCGFNPN